MFPGRSVGFEMDHSRLMWALIYANRMPTTWSDRHSRSYSTVSLDAGKTVCLLSLITSYQFANPSAGKLIYATRTVPEMNHVMAEVATVLAYRSEILAQDNNNAQQAPVAEEENVSPGQQAKKPRRVYTAPNKASSSRPPIGPVADGRGAGGSGVLALCLSSRRNMCVHDRVMAESDREAVDAACRSMTASWVIDLSRTNSNIETCPYFDNFSAAGESTVMPSGVYDLEELQKWGKAKGWCPYYLTRQAINHANILVFNYQYMLDPKVAKMVSKELEAESIVVFDEAHNVRGRLWVAESF